jgi:hypothetical protein
MKRLNMFLFMLLQLFLPYPQFFLLFFESFFTLFKFLFFFLQFYFSHVDVHIVDANM